MFKPAATVKDEIYARKAQAKNGLPLIPILVSPFFLHTYLPTLFLCFLIILSRYTRKTLFPNAMLYLRKYSIGLSLLCKVST